MLGFLLFPLRLTLLLVWVCAGLLAVTFVFPLVRVSVREWLIRKWSRGLMACCGIKIVWRGQPKLHGAVLFVANHVSWVDIFVLDSIRAVSFIAKSDIRKWPVLGWLVAGSGTLFIERGRRHAVRAVGHEMRRRFDQGLAVGLFPEATTSEGFDVMPFHTSLFEPAVRAGVDIQPVALRFFHRGQRTDRYAFVGEQTLIHNLWNLLTTTGTVVDIVYCPVISANESRELGRAGVAQQAHQLVAEVVRDPTPYR